MFQMLIAAMLAYFREHPDEAPVREVVGNYATFARSVRFYGWAKQTPPWNSPARWQTLQAQMVLLDTDVAVETEFETAMAAAFPLLFPA